MNFTDTEKLIAASYLMGIIRPIIAVTEGERTEFRLLDFDSKTDHNRVVEMITTLVFGAQEDENVEEFRMYSKQVADFLGKIPQAFASHLVNREMKDILEKSTEETGK